MKCTCINEECKKTFEVEPEVECPHCNKKQKISESVIASLVCLAGFIGFGGYLYNKNTHNRYPIIVEYNIINRCVNDDNRIPRSIYRDKFTHCVNTLEKTIEKVSYDRYKEHPEEFNIAFQKYFMAYEKNRN